MGKRTYEPDFRPEKRVKDPKVAKEMHLRGLVCVLCGNPGTVHHFYPRGQGGDDVRANCVGLCGSGTTGCHGDIENGDVEKRRALGAYVMFQRPDFVAYMKRKLGETEGVEWLRNRLFCNI
jgi:hypothetical protein